MIGFVILNYLTYRETIECVESIRSTCSEEYLIAIVDNASPNESFSELRKYFDAYKNIRVMQNQINNGYSAGNNFGIYAIEDKCEFIVICNSDVLFLEETITELISPLQSNQADVVAPRVLKKDGKEWLSNQFCPIGKKELVLGYSFLKRLDRKKTFNRVSGNDMDRTKKCRIYAPSGCCFAIKTSVLSDIGYFDENTFLGYEEAILGYKLREKGYICIYNPKAPVYHLHMASTKQIGAKSLVACTTSEMYYVRNYINGGIGFSTFLFIIRLIEFVRLMILNSENKKWLKDYVRILRKIIKNDLILHTM